MSRASRSQGSQVTCPEPTTTDMPTWQYEEAPGAAWFKSWFMQFMLVLTSSWTVFPHAHACPCVPSCAYEQHLEV